MDCHYLFWCVILYLVKLCNKKPIPFCVMWAMLLCFVLFVIPSGHTKIIYVLLDSFSWTKLANHINTIRNNSIIHEQQRSCMHYTIQTLYDRFIKPSLVSISGITTKKGVSMTEVKMSGFFGARTCAHPHSHTQTHTGAHTRKHYTNLGDHNAKKRLKISNGGKCKNHFSVKRCGR